MDLIERQQALDILEDYSNDVLEVQHGSYAKARRKMCELSSAQPEYTEQDVWEAFNAGYACGMSAARPEWHECFEDDPSSFPDDDRNVLVSFSNFSLSIIGQWRVDDNGSGCWYLGDTDETFLEEDLFVDGWWELPRKPRRN